MGCLVSLIKLMFIPMIFIFQLLWAFILFFWELFIYIISTLFDFFVNGSAYSYIKSSNNKKKRNIKRAGYKDMKFNKEADLWGLSENDKKIARQERMSPADFIEAEERDDDELVTDEWDDL